MAEWHNNEPRLTGRSLVGRRISYSSLSPLDRLPERSTAECGGWSLQIRLQPPKPPYLSVPVYLSSLRTPMLTMIIFYRSNHPILRQCRCFLSTLDDKSNAMIHRPFKSSVLHSKCPKSASKPSSFVATDDKTNGEVNIKRIFHTIPRNARGSMAK